MEKTKRRRKTSARRNRKRRRMRGRGRGCYPYLAEEQNSLSHSVRSLSQRFRYVFHLDHAAQARCHLGNRISLCICLFSFKYFTSLWIISVSSTYFDFVPVMRRTSNLVKHKGNKLQFFTIITLSFCSYL